MPSLAHLGLVALTRRAAVVLVAALMGATAQAALDSAGPAGFADSAAHGDWTIAKRQPDAQNLNPADARQAS